MKKILILLICIIHLSACKQLPVYQLSSQSTANAPEIIVAKSDGLYYSLNLEDDNIIVEIKTASRQTQMKMLSFGFTLWFNTEGNKKKARGIAYPQKLNEDGVDPRSLLGGGQGTSQSRGREGGMENLLKSIPPYGILKNFSEGESGQYIDVKNNALGIKISTEMTSQDTLAYYAVVPLKHIINSPEDLSNLTVGMISGSMDNSSQSPGRPGGGPGGGQGRPSSGGMSGGMGGGRPGGVGQSSNVEPSMQSMSQPIKIWTTLHIID